MTINDKLLKVWRTACRCRAFEEQVINASKAGRLAPAPFYLSIGQEYVPATIAEFSDVKWQVFTQHRCHSWYLAFGGDPAKLRDELLGLLTGCTGGRGGSASLHIPGIIYGHSGLLGDQAPIACGMALGSGKPTLVVFGDAAAEEDYVLASFGFAATKKLPILFVVEDNNLSILTETKVRRSWDVVEVASALGFGLNSYQISDDPLNIGQAIKSISRNEFSETSLPALLNVKVCRHKWHAGNGCDGPPAWNRHELVRSMLIGVFGDFVAVNNIEHEANSEMESVWKTN